MKRRWTPLPDAPEIRDCEQCGGPRWRDHWDGWHCARCDRRTRMASEHSSLAIQREWPLGEPDRSDDRETVIYEHTKNESQQ